MVNAVLTPEPETSQAIAMTRKPPWIRKGLLVKAILLAAVVMFVAETLRIFAGSNFHSVVPGKCYRSAQPSTAFLESAQRANGIRTIINLRGENEDADWYQEESQTVRRLGMDLIDAGLSSKEQAPDFSFAVYRSAIVGPGHGR